MGRPLPSLNALRAFEAAARLGSFTRAAEELHVTHAAVSRHVRGLEARLGVLLFRRLHKAVVPTEAGRRYQARLTEAFDRIVAATEEIAADARERLTLSVEPGFATRWLVPRLGRFYAGHPGIELDLDPTTRIADFRREPVDLAIRFGPGGWPDLAAVKLADAMAFPVCSPALLAAGPPLARPADLAGHTLIHDESRRWWATWLEFAGAPEVDAGRGPMLRDASLVLDAAAAGQGIALGDDLLAGDDLAQGRLVSPFAWRQPVGAYWLVWPGRRKPGPAAEAFRDWLLTELGRRS